MKRGFAMLKHTRILTLMALMIFAAGLAYAGHGGDKRWWRLPDIVQQLQLSDEEARQLEDAFEASRLKMIELKGQVEEEQFKLRSLMEKSDLDENLVWEQHRKLEKARSALADERFSFFVQVRKMIGYERFEKLLQLWDAHKQRHREE